MADDTQHLAEVAREGSHGDFATLYERVSPALVAWARLKLRGEMSRFADPEDLVQETWWRAFDRFPDFDPERGRFRSWVFAIASNVFRELIRRRTGIRGSVRAQHDVRIEALPPDLRAQVTSITNACRRKDHADKLTEFAGADGTFDRRRVRLSINDDFLGRPVEEPAP